MKSICLIALALVAACSADTYSSDKNVDLVNLFKDPATLGHLINCIIEKGECTTQEAAMKGEFPDALATACAKCTDSQKHNTNMFLIAFKKNFPEEFSALSKNFDPESKLFPALQKAVAAY